MAERSPQETLNALGLSMSPHKLSLYILMKIYHHVARVVDPQEQEDYYSDIHPYRHVLRDFLLREIDLLDPSNFDKHLEMNQNDMPDRFCDLFREPTFDQLRRKIHSLDPNGIGGDLEELLTDTVSAIADFDEVAMLCRDIGHMVDSSEEFNRMTVLGCFASQLLIVHRSWTFERFADFFDDFIRYLNYEDMYKPLRSVYELNQLTRHCIDHLPSLLRQGKVTPAELSLVLDDMDKLGCSVVQAHFLRYLVNLYQNEFEEALDSLHRYFDYFCESSRQAHVRAHPDVKPPLLHQYASLNLAILHFSFDHMGEATQAVHEAVRIAQQNNDHVCIMHCMSLLIAMSMSRGKYKTAGQYLKRCLEPSFHKPVAEEERDCADNTAPSEEAQAWLATAKLQLDIISVKTGSTMPLKIWTALAQSTDISQECNLEPVAAIGTLLRAGAWRLFGRSELSAAWNDIYLRFYDKNVRETRLSLINRSLESMLSVEQKREILSLSHEDKKGDDAAQALDDAILCIELEDLLLRGVADSAREVMRRIQALTPHKRHDIAFKTQAELLAVRVLIAEGQFTKAHDTLIELLGTSEQRGEHFSTTQILFLLSQVHERSGNAASALPHVLRAMHLCERLNLDAMFCEATVAMCRIKLSLGEVAPALGALDQLYPQILENCSLVVKVQAHIVMSKCLLALTEGVLPVIEVRTLAEARDEAADFIAEATDWANTLQYRDAQLELAYLEAFLHEQRGDISKRDAAAQRCLDLTARTPS